jgi:hypothetical protein
MIIISVTNKERGVRGKRLWDWKGEKQLEVWALYS